MRPIVSPILFCLTTLQVGGTESQLAMLATELSRRGVECHVFTTRAVGPLCATLEARGIRVHDGGFDAKASWPVKAVQIVRLFFRLLRLMRHARPRVVQGFLPLPNLLCALAGRLCGCRVVTSRRGLGTHQDRFPFWTPFDRIANRLSDVIVANSQAVAADTAIRDGIPPERIRVIPNGLDTARFGAGREARVATRASLGLPEEDFAIVTVANLIPYKGHPELIRAMPAILAARPATRLLMVGEDRGEGPELKALAARLDVAARIDFLGRRDDIPALLGAADAFVLASHEEGSSNALLEAMAAGLPVVATDVGGNREALADGRVGMLVPARSPDALAEALVHLATAPGAAEDLARAARLRVADRYSVTAMVDAYADIHGELVGLPCAAATTAH